MWVFCKRLVKGLVEARQEKVMVWNQGCIGGTGEKGLDSGNILKIISTDFVNNLNMGCERKRGFKDDSKIFGLNYWENGVTNY